MSKQQSAAVPLAFSVRLAVRGMSAAGGIERLGNVLPIPRLKQLASEKGAPPSLEEAHALLVALEQFAAERGAVRDRKSGNVIVGDEPAHPGLAEAIAPLRRALA